MNYLKIKIFNICIKNEKNKIIQNFEKKQKKKKKKSRKKINLIMI